MGFGGYDRKLPVICNLFSILKDFAMKKLILFTLVMTLAACQKESTIADQPDLTTVVSQRGNKNHPVPFHAEFASQMVTIPPQPNPAVCGMGFPVLHIDQTLSGNATHMGNISGTMSSCANVSTSPPTISDRRFELQAANGDWLYIVEFIIVGGTGRFEDATGSVTGYFEVTGPGQFMNYLDGEIQY